ncbi:MAG: nuclear transport factor 2 family protein [Pseudomonadales bacterium]|nr:nuclear transport factor 2 family protein [Halioglobus sp.]MCP5131410.1 nuclear transport factor 2 family protein [Pseudomonadales bacterium]
MEAADKIKVVEKYVEAFATSDMGIIREIYADNARVEDPVGTPVHEGWEAVQAFYETALKSGAKLSLTGKPCCAGNAVAFSFKVVMPGMNIDIIDVFEFDTQGKVNSMKAYWGPDSMSS